MRFQPACFSAVPLMAFSALLLGFVQAPPDGPADMAAAVAALRAELGAAAWQQARMPMDDANRTEWAFVPGDRRGLRLADMPPSARVRMHALLRNALSERGYLKAATIMSLESVLREIEGSDHRDPERYWLAVFGEPESGRPWGWRFEGHHLSLNFTLDANGTAAFSAWPMFLGANPATVPSGARTGLRVLGAEEDLGRALQLSLTAEQAAKATLAVRAPGDILTGPGRPALDQRQGLAFAALDAAQQAQLMELLASYANLLRPAAAARELERIRASQADLHFAWAGGTAPGEGHYWRVHGRHFLIEYDNVQNGANHVHTVWHDLDDDFGAGLLRRHRVRAHAGD
ncbi:MAG TPA: DUF3500 domain-containing protein [Planctomycetota bacterium]